MDYSGYMEVQRRISQDPRGSNTYDITGLGHYEGSSMASLCRFMAAGYYIVDARRVCIQDV